MKINYCQPFAPNDWMKVAVVTRDLPDGRRAAAVVECSDDRNEMAKRVRKARDEVRHLIASG